MGAITLTAKVPCSSRVFDTLTYKLLRIYHSFYFKYWKVSARFLFFQKIDFKRTRARVCMCVCAPMESRGILSPDVVVTGSCELPDVGSGKQT